ncbi:MAG: response regulator transcription factor, partial [Dehalococcoidia bacterium]
DRERQVLQELVRGASNRQIADTLFISERTVKAHLASIFDKLDVRDRASASATAVKLGLVELG